MMTTKFNSLWDELISPLKEVDEEVDYENELASALYIDDDGNEFSIDQLNVDDDEEEEDEETISEALKKVKVVRGGKRMKKFKTNKPGFKVQMKDGRAKEVKMSSKEKMTRKKAAKKAARSGKSKRKMAVKKRAKSVKKRIK